MANILIVLNGETKINFEEFIKNEKINYIIAVDGGYNHLYQQNIIPNLVVGDLDSIKYEIPKNIKIKQFSPIKDETDFQLAIAESKQLTRDHKSKIKICGFHGFSRVEHFYANLLLMECNFEFHDKDQKILLLKPGIYSFNNEFKYVSLFAKEKIEKLSLVNYKYELFNASLNVEMIQGISNEIFKDNKLLFEKGRLYVFFSND